MQDLETIGRNKIPWNQSFSRDKWYNSCSGNHRLDMCFPKDQLYPNVSIKQRTGNELKVVYCGQDLSMYDEIKQGFEHHFLQPCYMEGESVEQNGKNFAIVENPLKKLLVGVYLCKHTNGWGLTNASSNGI